MSSLQKLNTIKKYNPQFIKDDDLINQFILRQKPYETVINSLKDYNQESTPQHFLVVGQRGMGKSTLLKRIEIELRKNNALSNRFIPILLPEEIYNVEKLTKFWLKVLESVLDYFEITKQGNLLKQWENEIEKLTLKQDEQEVYSVFENIFNRLDKKPVILIDNIHILFSGLSEDDNWTLRSRLTGRDAPVIISASPTAPDIFSDYHQAFYDYFKILHLDPIKLEEFEKLVHFWINNLEDSFTQNEFYKNKQRLEGLFRLSGGNLRTIVMLFVKMTDGFSEHIDEDLENLLDEITPLYKARIEELPEQLRNIVDAIGLHWDPIDLKTIKNNTGIETNVLSPQIKRLRSAGWITNIDSKTSKGDKYEIVERFFNIWHIMRSSTRRSKNAVRCLAGFIEEYYGSNINKYANNLLNAKIVNNQQLLLNLAALSAIADKKIHEQLYSKILLEYENILNIDPNIKNEVDTLITKDNIQSLESNSKIEKIVSETIYNKWISSFENYMQSNEYEKCEEFLIKEIELYPNYAILRNYLGTLYHFGIKDYEKAFIVYQKSLKIDPNQSTTWYTIGNIYQEHLDDFALAEKAYEKAIELDPNFEYPWNSLGNLYQDKIGYYEKSEKAYLKSIKINPQFANSWNGLGNLYQKRIKDYKKSEEAYLKAIEIDPNFEYPWHGLACLYQDCLSKFDDSKNAYNKALDIDPNLEQSWIGLGNLYQDYLHEYDQAEIAYKNALSININNASTWNSLGNLYKSHFKDIKKAKEAYEKSIELDSNFAYPWNGLGNLLSEFNQDHYGAEKAYLKAIDIDPKLAYTWDNLAKLYRLYLKQNKKSEEAYLKAIEIDPNYSYFYGELGNLYQFYTYDYVKARDLYLRAIEIDSNISNYWYSLANLYQEYFKDYTKAEKAYFRAIEIDPKTLNPWCGLGNLYQYCIKDFKKSEESYQKAIDLDTNNVYAWYFLGDLYLSHLDELMKSEHALIKAVEINPNFIYAWQKLAFLHHCYLRNYAKAEEYYYKVIEINSNLSMPWNGLGDLYHDHLLNPIKAKEFYKKSIDLDGNIFAKLNLIFLLRDRFKEIDEAREIFNSINQEEDETIKDSYHLNESLFHIHDLDFGNAATSLKLAISFMEKHQDINTFDDWIRYVVASINKGFGSMMLDIFSQSELSIRMRPLYEAVVALQKNDENHFNDVAVEVRVVAKDIYKKMKNMEKH